MASNFLSTAIVRSIWRFYVHFYFLQAFPRRLCCGFGRSYGKSGRNCNFQLVDKAFLVTFVAGQRQLLEERSPHAVRNPHPA